MLCRQIQIQKIQLIIQMQMQIQIQIQIYWEFVHSFHLERSCINLVWHYLVILHEKGSGGLKRLQPISWYLSSQIFQIWKYSPKIFFQKTPNDNIGLISKYLSSQIFQIFSPAPKGQSFDTEINLQILTLHAP